MSQSKHYMHVQPCETDKNRSISEGYIQVGHEMGMIQRGIAKFDAIAKGLGVLTLGLEADALYDVITNQNVDAKVASAIGVVTLFGSIFALHKEEQLREQEAACHDEIDYLQELQQSYDF